MIAKSFILRQDHCQSINNLLKEAENVKRKLGGVDIMILPAFSGQLIKPPFYYRSRPGFGSHDRSDDVADYKTLLCNQK